MRTVLRLTMALAAIISLAACDYFDYDPLANPTVTIAWVSPAANAFIDGNVTFNVATTGPVERVDFLIDGQEVDSTTTGSTTIDMANEAPGYVTVSARAVTTDGFEEVVTRRFRIAGEAPMIDWVEPESQDTFVPHQRIDMHVEASDMSGTLTSVVFKIGNDIVERFDDIDDMNVSEPTAFEYRYEGFEVVAGNVTLSAVATNEKGLTTTVTRNIVIVPPAPDFIDRERPDVWWDESTIRNNEVIDGTHTVQVRGEDNVRIAFFDFYINGSWVDRKAATYDTSTLDPRAHADWDWNTALGGVGSREYPDGMYVIEVIGEDTSGNRSSSARATVEVDNDDNEIPRVAWYNPAQYDGKTVSGVVALRALGEDGHEAGPDFDEFELFINGAFVSSVDAVLSSDLAYSDNFPQTALIQWDTTNYPDGTYELTLVGIDDLNNRSAPAKITLVVDNDDNVAPIVVWYEPLGDDKIVSGAETLFRGAGVDNVSVTDFEIYINDYLLTIRPPSPNVSPLAPEYPDHFSYNWDLTGIANGDYELKLIGRDAAGNRSEPAIVTITVSNTTVP